MDDARVDSRIRSAISPTMIREHTVHDTPKMAGKEATRVVPDTGIMASISPVSSPNIKSSVPTK